MTKNTQRSASKPHWLTWVALVLWLATIAYGGYFFVLGSTTKSVDKRVAVVLSPHEREFVLAEMRSLVLGLQGVMTGLAEDDMGQVATSLSSMGMKMAVDDSQVLLGKLPMGLKRMGMGLHRKMDRLAAALKADKISKKELLTELSTSLGTCAACHATYKIVSDAATGADGDARPVE